MENENQQPENHAQDPMHGVKLQDILEKLLAQYGWEGLSEKININCFKSDPSIKSSLTFLRKTPWARDKVEQLYLRLLRKKKN
ncbi:MAG TPA: VF530 family protein [Edaphocola sp.]|nr:VF530 family protein [Edaphocola sp.]